MLPQQRSSITTLNGFVACLYSVTYRIHTLESPGRLEQPAVTSSFTAHILCGQWIFHFLFSASTPHIQVKDDSLTGKISFFVYFTSKNVCVYETLSIHSILNKPPVPLSLCPVTVSKAVTFISKW